MIESIVEHGTHVKAGDRIISFESDKIKHQMTELETKVAVDRLNLEKARDQLNYMRPAFALQILAAERDFTISRQDLKRFKEIFRASHERQARFSVEDLRNRLEYEESELKQLQKMYAEDNVSEETEEIVLRRQQDWIDKIKFFLKETSITSQQQLEVELPRHQQILEDSLAKSKIEIEQLKLELPAKIRAQELQIQQQELQLDHETRRLAALQEDARLMDIQADDDCVVYFGTFERGKWQMGAGANHLSRGGRIQPFMEFITLLQLSPFYISAECQRLYR